MQRLLVHTCLTTCERCYQQCVRHIHTVDTYIHTYILCNANCKFVVDWLSSEQKYKNCTKICLTVIKISATRKNICYF